MPRDYSFLPCPKCGARLNGQAGGAMRSLWKCVGCGGIRNMGAVYWGSMALERTPLGGFRVKVDNMELSPEPSQALVNHSPNGFNWGYGGSGPAQLALALLLDSVGEQQALELYHQFKEEVVAQLPSEFYLSRQEIVKWVKAQVRVWQGTFPVSSQYAEGKGE